MGKWAQAGRAPKTIRNRLWSLGHLYRVVLGPLVETPVDGVEPPAKVRTVITPVTPELILSVYRRLLEFEQDQRPAKKGENRTILRDAKTRARFMVRASTGRRPSEIMRAEPDDVDLGNRVWRVRDGKGGWSEGLYLNDDMLIAWMTFAQAHAWGPFDTGSMAEVLRHAGWPSEKDRQGRYLSRPYHLRHTLGMDISERGVDLADVGGWLGHTSLQTTRSIYAPIINSRMRRISDALGGRLSRWQLPETVPSAEPRTDVETVGDAWNSTGNPHVSTSAQQTSKQAKVR
jgi:integrase